MYTEETYNKEQKARALKALIDYMEINYDMMHMDTVLTINISLDSLKKQLSKLPDIEKCSRVVVYFDGHATEFTPKFVTKQEFKGLK